MTNTLAAPSVGGMAEQIPLEPIDSSNLSAVGYHPEKAILAVQFKSGAVYHYASVPLAVVTDFYTALSKGQYYALHIKGKYQGQKMTGHCPACGAQGWIGDRCEDCGCAAYADDRAPRPVPA